MARHAFVTVAPLSTPSSFCRTSHLPCPRPRFASRRRRALLCAATVPTPAVPTPAVPTPTRRDSFPNATKSTVNTVGATDEGLSFARIMYLARAGWRLSAPFFKEDSGAKWHLALVVLLILAGTALGLRWTILSGALMNALTERQISTFIRTNVWMFLLCATIVPLSVVQSYTRGTLRARWKRYLTRTGLNLYFSNRNYFKLACEPDEDAAAGRGIDNPDEILNSQIGTFTSNMIFIITDNVNAVFDISAYSVLLFKLSPLLFFVTFVLVGLCTVFINRVGKRLVAMEAYIIQLGANFRFALARARIYAESIAFYRGDKRELENSTNCLNVLVDAQVEELKVLRPVNAMIRSFFYIPLMLPTVCLAPRYFKGLIKIGTLTQASTAFHVLSRNLSVFVDRYDWYAYLGASLERLNRFMSFVEAEADPLDRVFGPAISSPRDFSGTTKPALFPSARASESNGVIPATIITNEIPGSEILQIAHLSLHTPGHASRRLFSDISLTVTAGERLLIMGPSGVGKTSLLRAIAGLWTSGTGTISRSPLSEAFFIPQRPYCVQGSLREQLLYPRESDRALISDAQLQRALEQVGLEELPGKVGGFDAVRNWSDLLSVGETQRVAFARLFLSSAKLILMDEATASMDIAMERRMMRLVSERNCIIVSVGHRPSLLEYHDKVLSMNLDGTYAVEGARSFVYPSYPSS